VPTLLIALGLLALAALAWELWICEGAHLGPRFVVAAYDLAADRYDGIKRFDADWERRFIGEPLAGAIGSMPGVRVLDVGAGTGRTARALLSAAGLDGLLVCLEPSRRMLALGRLRAAHPDVVWTRGWARPLPFPSGAFDFVISLEMLEFTPRPAAGLAEMVRVLRPGGWLLITNRVGHDAPWILGRTIRRRDFPAYLQSAGLEDIDVLPWQVDYDLAWARKA
jgi:ubiquinone/menaquinone biosynthesis C-methylase UbiE